jgi:hypothetical protein
MIETLQRVNVARAALIVAGGLVAIAITGVAAKFCLEAGFAWKCPALSVFGVPCPSCGSTRAFAALAGFSFLEALKFNPLMVIGVCGLPFLYFANSVPTQWKNYGWPIFGTAVALNWLYLLFYLPR